MESTYVDASAIAVRPESIVSLHVEAVIAERFRALGFPLQRRISISTHLVCSGPEETDSLLKPSIPVGTLRA